MPFTVAWVLGTLLLDAYVARHGFGQVPGVQGIDLLMLMVLAAFNIPMVLLVFSMTSEWSGEPVLGSAFVRDGRVHVRLGAHSSLVTTLFMLCGASLVLVLIVGLLAGSNPSLTTMGVAWALLLASGVVSLLRQAGRAKPEDFDLILDERRRCLSLPAMFDRSERLELEWSQVRSITLEEHTRKDNDGLTWTSWRPTLVFVNAQGELQSELLTESVQEEEARSLVRWLRERLGA
jgi:hypothetical protein